ncbi:ricin-type beta-trefoil lectin domain protein [Streptomyces sp. NPDC051132]|uniref:RICIN domain-containing protein n=1 Tax=unclassified Streptomyces TaxID=2593676 RepID=UPI003432B8A5
MGTDIRRTRGILAAAGTAVTLAASLAVVPSPAAPARAAAGPSALGQVRHYGPSTWLTNKASGLTGFVNAPQCHDQSCLNGSPIGLGTDRSTFQAFWESADFFEIQWWGDRCLDVSGVDNGTKVLLQTCNGASTQLWQKVDLGGSFGLLNMRSGRCLDAPNSRFPYPPLPSGSLQVWDCARSGEAWRVNQVWDLDT